MPAFDEWTFSHAVRHARFSTLTKRTLFRNGTPGKNLRQFAAGLFM